jgi:predicted nucleic acid-binding protein
VKVFLDTWVLIEKYKGNPDAEKLFEIAKTRFEAHISYITIAELMNVISREYGEREARIQHAYIKRAPLQRNPLTEENARDAGLLKTKHKFSLADAIILATALTIKADVIVTGGNKQFEKEWKNVAEIQVLKLSDFVKQYC